LTECAAVQKLSVLYVDDDPDIREVAVLSLELDGAIETRLAESGAQALAFLDDGLTPDAILLDVMMPDLDGPSTLARIRQKPRHLTTPVIFITARALREEQTRLMDLGARGVITKPFDPLGFAHRVREILAG
jgi:CheY-like chemotaxis protein